MSGTLRTRSVRPVASTCAIVLSSLLFGSLVLADQAFDEGASYGDVHKGKMEVPLAWSRGLAPEVYSYAVPNNCEGTINLTARWDEEKDYLKIRLRGDNVLVPHPTVQRTLGVNFFPNDFWPEEQSYTNGHYQLWLISPAESFDFYYKFSDKSLVGSELDFPSPPPGTFPVHIPGVKVLGSDHFQPDENGDLDVEFTWSYSGLVRLDRPELAHMMVSFPPHKTCEANPFRYDLSTTRGYISEPRPEADARPWSAYFENGIIFLITIEPPVAPVEPPRDTQVAVYSNVSGIGGLIPKGYVFDIDAFFSNVAPPIKPLPQAATCQSFFSGLHTTGLNNCN